MPSVPPAPFGRVDWTSIKGGGRADEQRLKDEVEQLRVVGYLCQMMMEMAESELQALKLLQEMEDRRRIVVANN